MISAIVIGKNEGQRLDACFEHIRAAMGYMLYELIYVDSRSSDDSVARAQAHGARCFVLDGPDTTAGMGRRIGAKEARGEYLLFLDGDMQLAAGFIEKAMMAMQKDGWHGATGIRDDVYMKDGREAGRQDNYFGCTQTRAVPEFGGALFIKADALALCGGWSGNTIACEEAELHARLTEAKLRIVELPVPMIVHVDAVRDNRGVLSAMFSKRRLGEGQALRCAMAQGKGMAYLRHEKRKFSLYALDLCCFLLLLVYPAMGLLISCFVQAMQLSFFAVRRMLRAFVSQKLFFFAFPLGMLTYRVRSEGYTEATSAQKGA